VLAYLGCLGKDAVKQVEALVWCKKSVVCGRQVLHFEQMLTTGGGWQDQVGGLSPGIKVGHSKAEIPVKVDVTFLKVSDEVIQSFGDQLVLVYTGKTRLARNLLQVILLK